MTLTPGLAKLHPRSAWELAAKAWEGRALAAEQDLRTLAEAAQSVLRLLEGGPEHAAELPALQTLAILADLHLRRR